VELKLVLKQWEKIEAAKIGPKIVRGQNYILLLPSLFTEIKALMFLWILGGRDAFHGKTKKRLKEEQIKTKERKKERNIRKKY
jgi:hypothetical protein